MDSANIIENRLFERDRRQRAVIVTMAEAIAAAIEHVAPAAQKNSAKGDEAMAVLSRLTNAMHAACKLVSDDRAGAA